LSSCFTTGFRDFRVKITQENGVYRLYGEAYGEQYNPSKHPSKVEIKAVTYSLMEIHEEKDNCYVKFVLDI